jgi:hypothetical protein
MGYLLIHFKPPQDVDEIARAYGQACPAFQAYDEWHDHDITIAREVCPDPAVVVRSVEDARAKCGRALFVTLDLFGSGGTLSGSLHANSLLISPKRPLMKSLGEDQNVQAIVRASQQLIPESRVEIVE